MPGLVITVRPRERVRMRDQDTGQVVWLKAVRWNDGVRIWFDAPTNIEILREKLIKEEK